MLRQGDVAPVGRDETLPWLWRALRHRAGHVLALTAAQAAGAAIGVAYALLFRSLVDSAVAGDVASFRASVASVAGLVLVQLAVGAVARWLCELARTDMENALKARLVDGILRKDYASVAATHTAEWLNRLTSDTAVVADGAVGILPGLVGTVVRLVSALVMIVALDPWFGYVLVPGGLALVGLTLAFRGVLKRLHKGVQESDGRLRTFLQERISALMVIKAFAAEGQVRAGADAAMGEHRAARLRRNRFSNAAGAGFGAAMQGMYLLGVTYCAHGIMTGRVTYGTLTAIMQLIGQVQGPFASISGYLPRWYAMCASAERLMEVEALPDDGEVLGADEARGLYEKMASVGLKSVSFSYREGEPPAVPDGLCLEVRRGEAVALTGHSGCGKSTALKLLMCMYPLDAGERYLMTADGATEPLAARHRRLFAYVPQGNALMSGTIRDVVAFAEPAAAHDDGRLWEALRAACCDEFVGDVDAELGERGSGLSEGQTQRLAIARAIFSGAPILLLDEATSALDAETERRVLENVRGLEGRTVVAVTHRPAALEVCDRVLEFLQGGVDES